MYIGDSTAAGCGVIQFCQGLSRTNKDSIKVSQGLEGGLDRFIGFYLEQC